jgi:glycosyltransferase involved in cell wall biosynthesis
MRNPPLRVAMLGPISWRTPPLHYGPWEFVVSNLTEQLVKLGVDVTLFASLDSRTHARLRGVAAGGYSENRALDRWVWTGLHISELFESSDEFDIIHNHFDFLPLTYSRLVRTPVLTTIHGISSDSILPVYDKYRELPYVSISFASRHEKLNYVRNIYQGIDPKAYFFNDRPDNYLLFLGRICAEKGVHEAIELARRVGRPLRIAGIIQDPVYFRESIEPYLDGERTSFLGPVGGKRKKDLLSGAFASVHLCNCEEAFGLSIIESLACGTPVIATRRGAIPEILDERCGLVVESLDEAESQFKSVARIVRGTCRQVVEERFTAMRMAKEYLDVYCELVDSRNGPHGSSNHD